MIFAPIVIWNVIPMTNAWKAVLEGDMKLNFSHINQELARTKSLFLIRL